MIPDHDRLHLPGSAEQNPHLPPELKSKPAELLGQLRADDQIRRYPAAGNALKRFQLGGF
jgi:hypothetical protein